MKLKYNQNGVTETIPLSTRKKQGKRLAIHHNDQNHYAPVVPTDDPKASNLPVGVNGEIFAVQAQEPPEVTAVNVAPSSVAVMQGQSATATVSAIGNDAITGLSYGLSGAPTWITISDDLILIQPSDNDLGFANVQVYAQDTGSDAMSAAILRAEAKLRPIIESLSIIPPAVTVQQGQSAIAGISAVANEAVTGLSYSLNGASSWVNLNGDVIQMNPTDNDLGSNTVDVIAYDTNSSASAATQFVATAALRPIIESVSVNPPTVAAIQGESTTATISAVANEAVTGLSYSLDGNPDWMNLSDSVILMTPTENDSGSAVMTVFAYDTNSSASAATQFTANVEARLPQILDIVPISLPVAAPWDQHKGLWPNLFYATVEDGISSLTSAEKLTGPDWFTIQISPVVPLRSQIGSTRYLYPADMGEYPIEVKYTSDVGTTFTKQFTLNITPAEKYFAAIPNSFTLKTSGSTQDVALASLRAYPSSLTGLQISLTGEQPAGATIVTSNNTIDAPYKYEMLNVRYIPNRQSIGSTASMSIISSADDCANTTHVLKFYNAKPQTCNKKILLK